LVTTIQKGDRGRKLTQLRQESRKNEGGGGGEKRGDARAGGPPLRGGQAFSGKKQFQLQRREYQGRLAGIKKRSSTKRHARIGEKKGGKGKGDRNLHPH